MSTGSMLAGATPGVTPGETPGVTPTSDRHGAPTATGKRRTAFRWLASPAAFAVLAVLAVVLFVVGSVHPPTTTDAARISHLESVIKCPSCEDLSLAQSDAPSAVALKNEITGWVHAGWSDGRIESWVVAHDGPGGLLVPQESGLSLTLYVVPAVLVGGAAACLGVFFWRRRLRSLAPSDAGGVPSPATGETGRA